MTEHKKYPLLLFAAFAVIANILCWASIIFYDWAIDERNLLHGFNSITESFLGFTEFFLSAFLPVVFYFLFEKHFVSESRNNAQNTFFQILIWSAICIAVSLPICIAVNNNRWIIEHEPEGFLDLDGI